MGATHDNAGIAAWRFKLAEPFDDGAEFSHHALYDFLYDGEALCERKLGPQMVVRRRSTDASEPIEIVLYDTPIIRYYNDGTFSVDNGGFNTPTTRERLDAVLPPGFTPFHERKQLGLMGPHKEPAGRLWPLNHDIRIKP